MRLPVGVDVADDDRGAVLERAGEQLRVGVGERDRVGLARRSRDDVLFEPVDPAVGIDVEPEPEPADRGRRAARPRRRRRGRRRRPGRTRSRAAGEAGDERMVDEVVDRARSGADPEPGEDLDGIGEPGVQRLAGFGRRRDERGDEGFDGVRGVGSGFGPRHRASSSASAGVTPPSPSSTRSSAWSRSSSSSAGVCSARSGTRLRGR